MHNSRSPSGSAALAPISLAFVAAFLAPWVLPHVAAGRSVVPDSFTDELVVGGLNLPTGIAFLPDDRLLFVEQTSRRVRLIVNGALSGTDPVCIIPDVRTTGSNRGVYGIAVDPRWPQFPYVYVHYPLTNGRLALSRYTVAGDVLFQGNGALTIDPVTRHELFSNFFDAAHNGGTVRFGPDQMLYASVGDSFLVSCSAQDTTRARGSILRLEVRNLPAGPGGPPTLAALTPPDNPFVNSPSVNQRLVWARGLRNPFRFHIDPADGSLFIADVGEANWEEIDRSTGGENFGWPLFEGAAPYSSCAGVPTTGLTAPIHAYSHSDGFSVTGLGVYRRPASGAARFPAEYDGDYFFADYVTGILRRLRGSGGSWAIAPPAPGQPSPQNWGTGFDTITDAMPASDGSLWYCRQSVDFVANTGQIRRIAFNGTVGVSSTPGSALRMTLQVTPSPSHGTVRLRIAIPAAAVLGASVHDARGRHVRVLSTATPFAAGDHGLDWNGRDDRGVRVPPGVYWVRVRGHNMDATARAVVLD